MTTSNFTRRSVLRTGAAAGAGILGGTDLFNFAKAWAADQPWKPEAGAKLNLLRWKRFVEAEDVAFMEIVAAFTKATGVAVTVNNESMDDVQPKASVAANTGQGPDIVWGPHSLPFLLEDKTLEMTDVNEYLGKKYGGWVPAAVANSKVGNKWIATVIALTAVT